MKKAIEAVIKDLEQKQLDADHGYVAARDANIANWHDGYGEGIQHALDLLREVLAKHVNSDTNRTFRCGTDDGRDGQKDQVETL